MREGQLTVLTWNVYLGADHAPLVGTTAETLPAVASAMWRDVRATHLPTRAPAIARVIAREAPDVVALQEAYRWSVDGRRAQRGFSAPVVVYDAVDSIVRELAGLGASYTVAVRAAGVEAQLAAAGGLDLRFEDSVAI